MKYRIALEGHCGVCEVEEEEIGEGEGGSPEAAIQNFMESGTHDICSKMRWFEGWRCFLVGDARKVIATPIE